MRRAAVLLAALGLGACSSDGASDYSAYFKAVRESFGGSLGRGSVSRDTAAAIPYASMGVRFDSSNELLIVLASDTNGDQLWTSKAHIVLLTHDGRLRRTVGLDHDLSGLTAQAQGDLPPPGAALKGPTTFRATADFTDLGVFAAPITCRLAARGTETIRILGRGLSTVRVEETCWAPSLKWRYTNNYWADPENGFVWRSVQTVHPEGPVVQTEIFRPPG